MLTTLPLPTYTNDEYYFNFRNFDLFEMMLLGYLALNNNKDNFLIADRVENCPLEKVRGYYIDILDSRYALRDLRADDNLEDPEKASWILIRKEAFEKQSVATPFFRFTFS